MDRFHVLDDDPTQPAPLTVLPDQAAEAIEMRLALDEARARSHRPGRTNAAALESIDHVLTRPGSWNIGDYHSRHWGPGSGLKAPAWWSSAPAVLPGLQSLANQAFLAARPDGSELALFTERQREYLAGDLVRAVLPGTAHDLEVEQIHLESAVENLLDATEIYGRQVNYSDLRRVRGAVRIHRRHRCDWRGSSAPSPGP